MFEEVVRMIVAWGGIGAVIALWYWILSGIGTF